uniref:Uncharacterized protein n=1 Tax=Ditylenchus dipsaci TaxID=166011 RepID=A0A915DR84_9BILA
MSFLSYFKKDKDKESMGSNEERCDFNALNDKALDRAFMRYLEDMNIKGEKAESFFKSCDRKKKFFYANNRVAFRVENGKAFTKLLFARKAAPLPSDIA